MTLHKALNILEFVDFAFIKLTNFTASSKTSFISSGTYLVAKL